MKIEVRIIPGSRHHESVELVDGIYEVRIKERAIEGRANQAALKLLARHFDTAPSQLKILRGHTSRRKLISVN